MNTIAIVIMLGVKLLSNGHVEVSFVSDTTGRAYIDGSTVGMVNGEWVWNHWSEANTPVQAGVTNHIELHRYGTTQEFFQVRLQY